MLFNEPKLLKCARGGGVRDLRSERFSALQRAEIAEIAAARGRAARRVEVSVLFNEPKLLKFTSDTSRSRSGKGFSALQRAEIAEIRFLLVALDERGEFQCSSTSRNC